MPASATSGKHGDRELKTDMQGFGTTGNGYDALSEKGYYGQDMVHCNPYLLAAGILEITDAPEVVEAGKGYPCEQRSCPTPIVV